jgi:hypothetical protein
MENNAPKQYRVPEENLTTLQARIAKLAKRATKLNVPAPTVTVLSSTIETSVRDDVKISRRINIVTVTGETPKLAGWAFAAVLEPMTDESGANLGNVLRVVPGFEQAIPVAFRTAGNNCDHCQTARRRNETFVLVNESNEWKQVGRNCLRDFLGHQSPDGYAAWAEILIDAADLAEMSENDSFGGSQRIERFEAEEILALGACCIRLYGFSSNKTAKESGGQSTSGLCSEWINAGSKGHEKFEHQLIVEDVDRAQAADVYVWMQNLSNRAELNDYFYNLSVLGQGATFTARNFGLAISAISVWAKEQEREINRKKRFAEDATSQFVGVKGERMKFENLTLVYTQDFRIDFGVSTLYKFKTPEGNVAVWFASSKLRKINMDGIKVGDVVTLSATVKGHEIRDGVKQTKLTRAKYYEPKVKMATAKDIREIAWA